MTSKERLRNSLAHKQGNNVVIDFGATAVTGIHVLAIENLRKYYGLESRPVKVTEPYQMLGEIEPDLSGILGVDILGIPPRKNMFGFENKSWKEFRTFWGQDVLVPGEFNTIIDKNGDLLMFPEGDTSAPPSARMPRSGYFFDSIIRQPAIDDSILDVNDNLEEFSLLSPEDMSYWKTKAAWAKSNEKGIIANFGGTALGDIALVPGPWMKNPKGIRDITEWYMSTVMRIDYVKEIFERQSDIALENLKTLHGILGESIDAVFMCGTDFGTQDSQFCSPETFRELYLPYYLKMNNWIHKNTGWKTFKHSCGSIFPLIPAMIEAGFDIINPVQISAKDMDPQRLKTEFGDKVTFWGGGVDTQKTLGFGTPAEVRAQVLSQCDIMGKNGGFVFNTVHNIQGNVPVENLAAMVAALKEFKGNN